MLAGQRIVDVRHDGDHTRRESRIERACVGTGQCCESVGSWRDFTPVGGKKRQAQRHEHARAAVVGAAAAQADHESAQALVEQRANKFTHSARRAFAHIRRHAVAIGNADDLRGLEHRRGAIGRRENAVGRIDRAAAGATHGQLVTASGGTDCREHRVERSFAAVGHRARHDVHVRRDSHQAARERRADVRRGERALE